MLGETIGAWAAVCSMIASIIASIVGYFAAKHSREANRAVNQRPKGEPTLYALARDTRDQLIEVKLEVKDMKPRIARLEQYSCRDPRFHGVPTEDTSSDNHKDG